jgi:hypothetical protein
MSAFAAQSKKYHQNADVSCVGVSSENCGSGFYAPGIFGHSVLFKKYQEERQRSGYDPRRCSTCDYGNSDGDDYNDDDIQLDDFC